MNTMITKQQQQQQQQQTPAAAASSSSSPAMNQWYQPICSEVGRAQTATEEAMGGGEEDSDAGREEVVEGKWVEDEERLGGSPGAGDRIFMQPSQQNSSQPKTSQERLLGSDLSNRRSSIGRETDTSNLTSVQQTTLTAHYEFLRHLSNSNKASAARSALTASVYSGIRDDSAGYIDASHQSIVMDQQFLEMKAKYLQGLGGLLPQQSEDGPADQTSTDGHLRKDMARSPSPHNLLSSLGQDQSKQSQERAKESQKLVEPSRQHLPSAQKHHHQLEMYSNIVAHLKRQKKQNSENPLHTSSAGHDAHLSSLISCSLLSGPKGDLSASAQKLILSYSDSLSQPHDSSAQGNIRADRSPSAILPGVGNQSSRIMPQQRQLQLVKALSSGQQQSSINEVEETTHDFRLSESAHQNDSIGDLEENEGDDAVVMGRSAKKDVEKASGREETRKSKRGEDQTVRRKGRGEEQSLVHIASNEGGDTNRGELTSARAARQVALEAEQSQHQRTFLQSFLTQRTQMSMLASQAQAAAPVKPSSPFDQGYELQSKQRQADGECTAEEWPVNLKQVVEPESAARPSQLNSHKIQFLNRVELLKQRLFMKSDGQESARRSSVTTPSNANQAPLNPANPEEAPDWKRLTGQSEAEVAQEKPKADYEYRSDNSEDHIVLNNFPQAAPNHKVDEILHIDLLDSALKISRTHPSASAESSDGQGAPSAPASRPSGLAQANQLPKNNAAPSMDAVSRQHQQKAETCPPQIGKLPSGHRTKNSSGDLFEFSEILQNEKRHHHIPVPLEECRQNDLDSDLHRELLNFPSDVGLEVRMQQLECEGTGGSGGTSLVTQHLYEQLQSRQTSQKQGASAPGSQPQPERRTPAAGLERSRSRTDNSLRLTNFSFDLPSKIHHEEITQEKNQRSPGKVHTPLSNHEHASNHFGYSSSHISYQFLPSCQQISFAHTTSFSKKGSDGEPNTADANAIQDSDEKHQRRIRLTHQESIPSELNKEQMIFMDPQRDARRSVAGKAPHEGTSQRPPSCISLKSLRGLVIPTGSNVHGMGTMGIGSARLNGQPFEQRKCSLESLSKSMKSRELMASVRQEKGTNGKGNAGRSTDGRSIYDVDSRDSGRQSVGSEANGAVMPNQAKDLRDVYTTQTLTATEKRSESYIKINSGREEGNMFQKRAEAANARSDSSSSLREAPYTDSIGAAELPRKTDQFKRIDEGVRRAAEHDFGFDEERFLKQMQLRDSLDSRPSSLAPSYGPEWQKQGQATPAMILQKQRIVQFENQILKLKQIIEQFEQDKAAQEAKTKKAEEERSQLLAALQECQAAYTSKNEEVAQLHQRIAAIQNDYQSILFDEHVFEQVLRKWMEAKSANFEDPGKCHAQIGQFTVRLGTPQSHGVDKAVGTAEQPLEPKAKETAHAAVQTEQTELPLAHVGAANPIPTVFEKVKEKNLESLRAALKSHKPKMQSFAVPDAQQQLLAAGGDRKVYRSFNQREAYGPVLRSALQACEHIGEVTESYNLTTCHDASNIHDKTTLLKSRSFIMSCSDNQTDRPPFTKPPADSQAPLDNPESQYRMKFKIKKQSSASSRAGTSGSNELRQSLPGQMPSKNEEGVEPEGMGKQPRSRSRSCSDQPSLRGSRPDGSIQTSCDRPSLQTPKEAQSSQFQTMSCRQFGEQAQERSGRSPSKASSGNCSKNQSTHPDLSIDDIDHVAVSKKAGNGGKMFFKGQKKQQQQLPGTSKHSQARVFEFTNQSQLKTYKLFNQQNLQPAGGSALQGGAVIHAHNFKTTTQLLSSAQRKRIPASPTGRKQDEDADDQRIYTAAAKKSRRLAAGPGLASASSCKSFKSLQLSNSKASPLNLNLTLKKQISNPKNDQILLSIAQKLKQKRESEEQLSTYTSNCTRTEQAFSTQQPGDAKRGQQMKRTTNRGTQRNDLLSSPKKRPLCSSNVNELYYSTQLPVSQPQKQQPASAMAESRDQAGKPSSSVAKKQASLRRRKSPSKSHRSPARVPVASSIVSAGMNFSELREPGTQKQWCSSLQTGNQESRTDDNLRQSNFSSHVLNASNLKFETSMAITNKEYFTMDHEDLEQSRRPRKKASGQLASSFGPHVRQPHTTRSISSIRDAKLLSLENGSKGAAQVKIGNFVAGIAANKSQQLLGHEHKV